MTCASVYLLASGCRLYFTVTYSVDLRTLRSQSFVRGVQLQKMAGRRRIFHQKRDDFLELNTTSTTPASKILVEMLNCFAVICKTRGIKLNLLHKTSSQQKSKPIPYFIIYDSKHLPVSLLLIYFISLL